jgi:hypothetical protein
MIFSERSATFLTLPLSGGGRRKRAPSRGDKR